VGRQINASNFKQSILGFLDNGNRYLVGYIPALVEKLKNLYQVVSGMGTYRFYASSLLILYDGAAAEGDMLADPFDKRLPALDIRMIDFANCVTNSHLLVARPVPVGPVDVQQGASSLPSDSLTLPPPAVESSLPNTEPPQQSFTTSQTTAATAATSPDLPTSPPHYQGCRCRVSTGIVHIDS
jgi:Inositol polyphosphate kinase